MAQKTKTAEQETLLEEMRSRLNELEATLGDTLEQGKGKTAELFSDVQSRIEELQDEDGEPKLSTLEKLDAVLDELGTNVEEELNEGTEKAAAVMKDLRERIQSLKQATDNSS